MQGDKNTEANKKRKRNEQKIPIIYLKSYDLIFTNECVNVEAFKKYNNEDDNFEIIDNAVEYIKRSDNHDREKHLDRVKAVKKEIDIDLENAISNSSLFAYLAALLSVVNFFISFSDYAKAKEFNINLLSVNPLFKTKYFIGSVKESDGSSFSFFAALSFAAVIMAIFVYLYFLSNIRNSKKYKGAIKYLEYLEQRLDSKK